MRDSRVCVIGDEVLYVFPGTSPFLLTNLYMFLMDKHTAKNSCILFKILTLHRVVTEQTDRSRHVAMAYFPSGGEKCLRFHADSLNIPLFNVKYNFYQRAGNGAVWLYMAHYKYLPSYILTNQ